MFLYQIIIEKLLYNNFFHIFAISTFARIEKRGFLPLSFLPGLNFEMRHTIHNTKIDIHAFLTSYMDDFKCISLNNIFYELFGIQDNKLQQLTVLDFVLHQVTQNSSSM